MFFLVFFLSICFLNDAFGVLSWLIRGCGFFGCVVVVRCCVISLLLVFIVVYVFGVLIVIIFVCNVSLHYCYCVRYCWCY